ncbi:MAG: TetR/AcrR family transcriptional regulator, partial [Acidimicrobiales bacterium]|nr:TetR/AcrR family transcriptional regulator [Acidimicrobiales bacterium]
MIEGDAAAVTRTDETARRLLAAAAEVFAERGYDGAGVAEIARRAGLTTGAIYSRFAGKAELLVEALRQCTPDEFDQLFAEHGFDGQAKAILRTVGSHLVTREADELQALLLEAFVAARRDPDVAALLREQFDERRARLAALLDAGKAAGVVDTGLDTYAVVHFAHAVGLGFLLYEALGMKHPDQRSWEEVVARVVAALDPVDA